MLAAAIVPGVLIGASLGLLGGGGSVLTVPIFVYILGFDPKAAIAMSLAVVAATSAVGTTAHWRAGHVNLRVAVLFAGVATVGTLGGVRLAAILTGAQQLIVFGVVMLGAAAFMLRDSGCAEEDARALRGRRIPLAALVPAGLLVGVLTGVAGVGGGFLIVPALLLMHASVREAIGTSLLIITINCIVGFLSYLGHVPLDWHAILLVAAATVPGIWIGSYLHGFVPPVALRRGFAGLLVVMAVFILYENLHV